MLSACFKELQGGFRGRSKVVSQTTECFQGGFGDDSEEFQAVS